MLTGELVRLDAESEVDMPALISEWIGRCACCNAGSMLGRVQQGWDERGGEQVEECGDEMNRKDRRLRR
jgi:hypothetical protein